MNFSFRQVCAVAWMAVAWIAVTWMLAASVSGQTQLDLRTQSKDIDFSTASSTKPIRTGVGLPGTCSVNEWFVDTSGSPGSNVYECAGGNAWAAIGQRIQSTTLANLPLTCTVGNLYYVTDATFAGGGWRLYTCTAANTWSQAGVEADGTGYFSVTCGAPGNCLVGPNLSVLPSLNGPNAFIGASDFSGASKTAMFRLASSAPVTCDATAHEAYYDTTLNSVSVCSSANTWTPAGGTSGSFLLYQRAGISALTATGSSQTLDSFVIPAGKLHVGDVVEIEATFTRTGSAAPMTFAVSFGGTAMQSVSTPTSSSSAVYKPYLNVTGTSSEVWGGSALVNGVVPVVLASSSSPAASISSAITVALTQSGTGPDSGAVASWFVKVTR